VQDRSKIMVVEDPIILDIMRSKEVTTDAFVVDVINP